MQRNIRLWGLLRRAQGQTMAEYALLIAIIALVVLLAAIVLGADITSVFGSTTARV